MQKRKNAKTQKRKNAKTQKSKIAKTQKRKNVKNAKNAVKMHPNISRVNRSLVTLFLNGVMTLSKMTLYNNTELI